MLQTIYLLKIVIKCDLWNSDLINISDHWEKSLSLIFWIHPLLQDAGSDGQKQYIAQSYLSNSSSRCDIS